MSVLVALSLVAVFFCTGVPAERAPKFTGKSNLEFRNATTLSSLSDSYLKLVERREPTAWRFNYIQEFLPENQRLLVVEETVDERLANVAYTSITARTNIDFQHFNSGDRQIDQQRKESFEGSLVDHEKCGQQLGEMLQLRLELSSILEAQRSNKHNPTSDDAKKLSVDERHLHLARVLDSFGRFESGFLSGRLSSMGSYLQCLNTNLLLPLENRSEEESVKTRFCWSRLSVDKHLDHQLRTRKGTEFESKNLVLMSGICIPKSCHTQSFERHRQAFEELVSSQFRLPKDIYLDETLELKSIFCLPDEDSPHKRFSLAGQLLVALSAAWLLFCLLATVVRSFATRRLVKNGWPQKIESSSRDPGVSSVRNWAFWLSPFDLYASMCDFLQLNRPTETVESIKHPTVSEGEQIGHEQNDQKIQFAALNPIKVMGTLYVVAGHSLLLTWNASENFLQGSILYDTDRFIQPMVVAVFVVDSFFVISSLLMCFGIMKQVESVRARMAQNKQQTSFGFYARMCMKFIAMRYSRLVPLYALVFWFNKTLFYHLNTGGPYADYGLNQLTTYGACRNLDSWWTPVSFMSAWLPMTRLCVPQAWSVSCDLFYTLTLVPICVLMPLRPRLALASMTIIGSSTFYIAWRAYLDADPMKKFEVTEARAQGITYLLNDFSYLYTLPHYRFNTVLIGCLAGYLLHEEERTSRTGSGAAIRLTMRLVRNPIFNVLAAAIAAQPFVAAYFMQEIRKAIPLEDRFYSFEQANVIHRIIWALSNAILFIRMITDWKNSRLMQMARSTFWRVLVKLDYSILLIHVNIIQIGIWSPSNSKIFTTERAFRDFFASYSMCLPIAALIYVLFESPLEKLTKTLWTKNK